MSFSSVALLATLVLAGCGSTTTPSNPGVDPEDSSTEDTPGPVADGAVGDAAAVDAFVSSGCPVPAILKPTDVPAGYLAPMRANFGYTVDGDTAHFYTTSGEQVVRFLYVNTEETSGAERTAFGEVSKAAVDAIFKNAKDLTLVIRQGSTAGTPDVDPFKRWLGLVFVDGELLQTRIIREGHSAYYTSFGCAPAPLHEAFLYAEAEANANDRGIWKPGHPTNYQPILADWIGTRTCRPNPYKAPYCS